MNTITEIINMKGKRGVNLYICMLVSCLITVMISCKQADDPDNEETEVLSDVQVTHPVVLDTGVYSEYQGTTKYLRTTRIRASITGIVTQCNAFISQDIHQQQPLFVIKTKETALLEKMPHRQNSIQPAADTVFAFSPGIINQINVQPGDFVQEGDVLATSVENSSLRVIVNVPLEENTRKLENRACEVTFPDGANIKGIIGKSLPTANENDQTNVFFVKTSGRLPATENIHVKVKVKTGEVTRGVFIPQKALFANEELTKFWVMKITGDTMALKVGVTPGFKTDSLIQVKNPQLSQSDIVVTDGGYGLPDSSLVNILKLNK